MAFESFNRMLRNIPNDNLGIGKGIADVGSWIGSSIDALTGKAQMDIAKENLDYTKEFNERIFEREDTATQRRVEDLVAAGLSPTLAAGSAASAGGTARAPERSMSGAQATQAFMMNGARSIAEALNMFAQVEKTKAETSLIKGRTEEVGYTNEVMRETLESAKDRITNEAAISKNKVELSRFESRMSSLQYALFKEFLTGLGAEYVVISNGETIIKVPEGKNPELVKYQALLATKELTEARSLLEAGTAEAFADLGGKTGASMITNLLRILAGVLK